MQKANVAAGCYWVAGFLFNAKCLMRNAQWVRVT